MVTASSFCVGYVNLRGWGQAADLVSNIDFRPDRPSPRPSPKGRGSETQYRGGYDFSGLIERAREFRKKQTPAEELLWELLRDRKLCDAKFYRQHQVGDHICDFYCHDARLVVECDGGPHSEQRRVKHDFKRDAYLRSQGLRVLRLTNAGILNDTEAVLKEITSHLRPSPSGRGAGGEGVQEMRARSLDVLGRGLRAFPVHVRERRGQEGR